jgi:beta-lactam-binding protein with PASTA domain
MLRPISSCFVIALCLLTACSQTPPPPTLITVPNVVGQPVPQAEAELQAAGLGSDSRVEGPCPACPPLRPVPPPTPTVLRQALAAGSHVAKGTVVVLTYRCVC